MWMDIRMAECINCGYLKENITFSSLGSDSYYVKGCRKCKIIINLSTKKSNDRELTKCPICGDKNLIDYEKRTTEKLKECPKCGEKKLKFIITGM